MLKANKPVIITFLAPAALCYVLVFLYPTFRTLAMSFFRVESVSSPMANWDFAGLANYAKLFRTPIFLQSLKNIGRIWFVGGCAVMILALIFAVILTNNTGRMRGTKFFRSAIYLPNVVSAVAMGTMWINYAYNSDYGLLHSILAGLGFEAASHTLWTAPGQLFWSMLAAYCFGMVGYHMLIFISGIEQIPRDFYEAAFLDGANILQRFFFVTIPNMRGVIRTNVVMWTVFTVGFFVWGQLFSPVNLSNDTVAPMNYMYELVFGSSSSAATARDSGAGAAIGVILMLSVVAIFFATNFIVKNDDAEL
ncbi:MAG: sugar ABC transporter permease [Spirochaetaceae bacterium]|jgi:multiple sugar transport system permease protein|nr:sugar ABC transporter permease [Spirochaetaceae bacterium]